MKKKLLAILLVTVMVFAIVACGNGGSDQQQSAAPTGSAPAAPSPTPSSAASPAPTDQAPVDAIPLPEEARVMDAITILGESPLVGLNTQSPITTGPVYRAVYSCIFDTLIMYSAVENEYYHELAKEWDISEDWKTLTFYLRDDAYFSNGDKFTAQSVIDTYELASQALGAEALETWRTVETVTAINDYTVEIVQRETNVDILYRLSLPWSSIVNKRAIEADATEGYWVGTGAYTVTELVPGDFVTIERRDDYWGGIMPTRQMTYKWIPEVGARTIMLQNREAEISLSSAPQDIPIMKQDPSLTVVEFYANTVYTMGFNMDHPVLSDKNFRLAVAHALSMPEIARVANGDWATPARDGATWGYDTEFRNPNLPAIQFNLDLAREYLEASNYRGEVIEICSGDANANRALEIIQEQLNQIGINTTLYPADMATISAYAIYGNNQAEMVHYICTFGNDARSARNSFYPFGMSNRASYNNPAVNTLLELAPTISDAAAREQIYWQVQELVAEDMPYFPMYDVIRTRISQKGVGGIVNDPDMNHCFKGVFIALDD